MTVILQISDTHIVPRGQLVSGQLDTAAALDRLVARIAQIKPQIGPVDAILVSGDLSDDGSAESYDLFRSVIAPLDLPVFVIPGNHDRREPMRAAFTQDGYLPETGRLNWHGRVGQIEIIGLDTLIEGQGGGMLDSETLAFLAQALVNAAPAPVLLALHHPPFDCGIAFMDRIGLGGTAELSRLLHGHDSDIRVLCGHIHNTMITAVGGKIAMSAPSPCSHFAYDLRGDAPVGFIDQPDGFLLHRWQDGLTSVRIPLDAKGGQFPF